MVIKTFDLALSMMPEASYLLSTMPYRGCDPGGVVYLSIKILLSIFPNNLIFADQLNK
jgi:hypothetical protein